MFFYFVTSCYLDLSDISILFGIYILSQLFQDLCFHMGYYLYLV